MVIDNVGNLWFVNGLEQVGRSQRGYRYHYYLSETDGYHRKDFDWSVPLAKDARGNLYFGTGYKIGARETIRVLIAFTRKDFHL